MKRLIAFLLVLVMALSLTGCDLVSILAQEMVEKVKSSLFGGSILGGDDSYGDDDNSGDVPEEESITPEAVEVVCPEVDFSSAEYVEKVGYCYYVIHGITEEQAKAYDANVEESLGVNLHGAGWVNGTEDPHFGNGYLIRGCGSVNVCFYKDTLVVAWGSSVANFANLFLIAGAPAELINEADLSPELELIDLSGAEISTWYGYTVQTLEGIQYSGSVMNYIHELEDQGYYESVYIRYPYTMDNTRYGYDNDEVLVPLCNSDETEYLVIAYSNGTLMVISSPEIITIPEAELCDKLNFYYLIGENYLQVAVEDLYYGPGQAYSTSGVAARYGYGELAD